MSQNTKKFYGNGSLRVIQTDFSGKENDVTKDYTLIFRNPSLDTETKNDLQDFVDEGKEISSVYLVNFDDEHDGFTLTKEEAVEKVTNYFDDIKSRDPSLKYDVNTTWDYDEHITRYSLTSTSSILFVQYDRLLSCCTIRRVFKLD